MGYLEYTSLSDNNWTPVGREKYEEWKDKVERFVQSSTAEPWDNPNFLREFSKLKAEIAECKDGAVKVGSLPLSNQMDELVLQLDNFFAKIRVDTGLGAYIQEMEDASQPASISGSSFHGFPSDHGDNTQIQDRDMFQPRSRKTIAPPLTTYLHNLESFI